MPIYICILSCLILLLLNTKKFFIFPINILKDKPIKKCESIIISYFDVCRNALDCVELFLVTRQMVLCVMGLLKK